MEETEFKCTASRRSAALCVTLLVEKQHSATQGVDQRGGTREERGERMLSSLSPLSLPSLSSTLPSAGEATDLSPDCTSPVSWLGTVVLRVWPLEDGSCFFRDPRLRISKSDHQNTRDPHKGHPGLSRVMEVGTLQA